MSNITFTIYALIPTLSSQVLEKLDVEHLTEELQHLAGRSKDSTVPPSLPTTTGTSRASVSVSASSATSESDFQHQHQHQHQHQQGDDVQTGSSSGGVGQTGEIGSSWVSEFVASSSSPSSSSALPDDHHLDLDQDPPAGPTTTTSSSTPGVSTLDTPGSQYDTLQIQSDIEVETGTDMSTSMSNITDPSPGSSSPDREREPEQGYHRDDDGEGDDVEETRGGQRGEERYLRSPSTSPRRARRVLPREHGDRDRDRTFHIPGTGPENGPIMETRPADGQGFSGVGRRDEVGTTSVRPEQGRSKAQLWGEIKVQGESSAASPSSEGGYSIGMTFFSGGQS